MEQTSTSTKKVNSSPVQYDYTQHSGLEVAPDSGLHAIEPDQGLYQLEPDSGLQVREPDRDNKEAAPPGYGYKHDGYNDGSGAPEAYDGNNLPETYHGQNGEEPPLPPTPNKRRKRLWIIIGVVALVVILAAVLGGVFGSRAANSDNDSAPVQSAVSSSTSSIRPTPTSNSTTSATPTPSTIAKLSSLTAGYFPTTEEGNPAGTQIGGIRVFVFQNPEGYLWATVSHLKYRERGAKNYSSWQLLQDVRIKNEPLVPQHNTGFAISGFASASVDKANSSLIHYDVTINVYYISEDGIMEGVKYIDGLANRGIQSDPGISKHKYTARTGSRVAAYHPWIVFQDMSGFINVADAHSEDESYVATNLKPIHGMSGTHLAVVPLSSNYDKIIDSSYGIFYQDLDGYLTPLIPGSRTGGSSRVESSWPDIDKFPRIRLPDLASFTAFSVARSLNYKEETEVNTFVLYQDESSDIKQVWTDDGEEWKQSEPEALRAADLGTDITCTGPSVSNDTYAEPLHLAPATNETRCYFQRGGWPVEVMLNGVDWEDIGFITNIE